MKRSTERILTTHTGQSAPAYGPGSYAGGQGHGVLA